MLYSAFCYLQQCTGTTAPKRRGMSEIAVHTCRIYLNHDSDCDRFAWLGHFLGASFAICYVTFGGGLEKC